MQVPTLRAALTRRGHTETLVHTGQHYDDAMSRLFFDQLGLPQPDVNLEVGSVRHGAQTGRMLERFEAFLHNNRFDAVVVDGDTNSTLAGALAASKIGIPCVHVESGLRSFDRSMPEEVNRVATDHLADLLCAPTMTALLRLGQEGLGSRAVLVGDVMYDSFRGFMARADRSPIADAGVQSGSFDLMTVHRPDNTDDPERMGAILASVAATGRAVLFPVHPRTRPAIDAYLDGGGSLGGVRLLEPVGYLEMLGMLAECRHVLTDSGGVQREAFFAEKPALIFRETTEWVEQVELGWSLLVGADRGVIAEGFDTIETLDGPAPDHAAIYGGGRAGERIAEAIEGLLL